MCTMALSELASTLTTCPAHHFGHTSNKCTILHINISCVLLFIISENETSAVLIISCLYTHTNLAAAVEYPLNSPHPKSKKEKNKEKATE